jgi:hypothetical protein
MFKRWKNHLPAFVVALAATIIGGYIVARLAGTPPSEIAAFLWSPFGASFAWLSAPARLTHWDVILLVLGLIALDYFLVRRLQRVKELAMGNISNHEMRLGWVERSETRPHLEPGADLQAPENAEANPFPSFEPEKFELTPPRCRALVALLQRVDARTTLHDLYQFVVSVGLDVDTSTTKGQLQHDMEEAEGLGIVSVDRAGELTAYYNLTIPSGRNWVLSKETELRAKASQGMVRRRY